MMTAIMDVVVAAKEMMTGVAIMKVEAGGIGALVLITNEEGAEALLVGEAEEALTGKEVKRGVRKLSNGIGKRKKLLRCRPTLGTIKIMHIVMVPHISRDMDIDQLGHGSFLILCLYMVWLLKITHWHSPRIL